MFLANQITVQDFSPGMYKPQVWHEAWWMNVIYSSRNLCTHISNYKNSHLGGFFFSVAAAILSRFFPPWIYFFLPQIQKIMTCKPFFKMLCNSMVNLKWPWSHISMRSPFRKGKYLPDAANILWAWEARRMKKVVLVFFLKLLIRSSPASELWIKCKESAWTLKALTMPKHVFWAEFNIIANMVVYIGGVPSKITVSVLTRGLYLTPIKFSESLSSKLWLSMLQYDALITTVT